MEYWWEDEDGNEWKNKLVYERDKKINELIK